jgi:uracil phosphoribosyltransferase
MTRDITYQDLPFKLNQIEHRYGEGVHILADPFAATQLARLCAVDTYQPDINRLVRRLYEHLLVAFINHRFPRLVRPVMTRMSATTPLGVIDGQMIDTETEVVSVDIARAGIVPSMVCYELLNELLNPNRVRQDHLMVSRVTDAQDHVQGAHITGGKIGGPVNDRIVLFPDPMGATGSSLAAAIDYYKRTHGGGAKTLVTLNLIITPEFIRCIRSQHPEVLIYAIRLDRGCSPAELLSTVPGTHWDLESGLNEKSYIVPGGGGFGEMMNNAWV